MRRIAFLSVFLAVAISAETPETKDSRVTIALEDYEKLRQSSEAPSATVIDTISLSGAFADRGLAIVFVGRTTGTRPLVRVMEQTNDITISSCKGNAILSRSGKGSFDLIPLDDNFQAHCLLRISGSDRLRMHVPASVLGVQSEITDGELVTGDEEESGAREYVLVRHVSGPAGETLAATATGRYRITLLPDATRFQYSIDVHNPNRTTSTLELSLQSSEHLQQIDSAAPYEIRDGRYVFSIPPGDSTIAMSGELRGTSFTAPVRASLQYLVIESHPLLRPSVTTPAKRISIAETGVTPRYRGALAFEAGTARIDWKVTRLEALHAISYAVNDATHTLFIPIDGPVLGESTFALRNEGAAELVLPPKPEPTYVSLGEDPVLMTKNAAGQLTVPLSPGEQRVLVQHRQPLRRGLGFVFGSVAVPQLSVPATGTQLNLSYPGRWIPLYESFASRATVWMPRAGQLAAFFFIAIWCERLLSWLGFGARRRFVIALTLALAATIVATLFLLTTLTLAALTVLWIATRGTTQQRALYGTLAAVAVGAFLLLYYAVTGVNKGAGSEEYSDAPMRASKVAMTDTIATDTSAEQAPAPQPTSPAYQGLPAKFTLPSGERTDHFRQELLRTDVEQRAFIIAVSLALTNWLGVLIALLPVVLLWRDRHAIADAIRARLTPPAEVQTA
ncbi:MAG TPA: hypothetical protein VKB93_10665 [Thermoanaerobaculia bacterium]|nr:hypothetical protein [Thermoanaerobaculia bacterium]